MASTFQTKCFGNVQSEGITSLESLVKVLQDALRVQNANNALTRENEELKRRADTAVATSNLLSSRNKVLEEGIEDGRKKKAEQKHRADCLQQANERLRTKVEELTKLNEQLSAEIQMLREEKERQQTDAGDPPKQYYPYGQMLAQAAANAQNLESLGN